MPPEPAEMNRSTASEPSMAASEPAEPGRLASFGPSMVAPKPAEIGRPAPLEPSAVAPKSVGASFLIHSSPPSQGRAQSGNLLMRSSRGRASQPKTSSYDGVKVSREFLHPFVLIDFCHNLTVMSLVASEGVGLSYG